MHLMKKLGYFKSLNACACMFQPIIFIVVHPVDHSGPKVTYTAAKKTTRTQLGPW